MVVNTTAAAASLNLGKLLLPGLGKTIRLSGWRTLTESGIARECIYLHVNCKCHSGCRVYIIYS
eukprot:COSAG01_NODE_1618_length_9716_cov_3.375689_3_plen_64_part_00